MAAHRSDGERQRSGLLALRELTYAGGDAAKAAVEAGARHGVAEAMRAHARDMRIQRLGQLILGSIE
eukprot:2616437-Prymnesium_polylepis.1